jgi:hypothetical protein
MSTFVNNDVASGAIVYASDHNTQGSLLAAVLNGGIDNANIASNAAIDGSKIADASITSSKFIAGAEGWLPISATLTVSSGYNKGNKEHDLTSSADLTSTISPGMRLKLTRGTTPPTQCTDLESSSSQYASKTSPSGVSFTDDFTGEAWIKLESYTGVVQAIVSRYNGTSGWDFEINGSGQVAIAGFNAGAANFRGLNSIQSVPVGTWVHVAATLDMSGSTGTIYINGASVATSFFTGGTSPTALIQAGDLEIGARNGSTAPFDGKVADVRMWSTIRTATQIRDNMNQQLVGNESGLVAYYKLNGNFNDSTANANNMTGQNSAVATNANNPMNSTEYAIVTKVTASTVTVFTGTDYNIPNMTLSTPYYSSHYVPFGFPANQGKWAVTTLLVANCTTSSATSGTWVNAFTTGATLSLPTGEWTTGYQITGLAQRSTDGLAGTNFTLATTTAAETDTELTTTIENRGVASSTVTIMAAVNKSKPASVTSQTSLYLNYRAVTTGQTVTGVFNTDGGLSKVEALCAYI